MVDDEGPGRFDASFDDGDGLVTSDPTDRIQNLDAYGEAGHPAVVIRLAAHRAEALTDALQLVDDTAAVWQSSERAPSGWQDLIVAVGSVTHALEQAGLLEPTEVIRG